MIDFDDSDLESQYEDRHTDYQDGEWDANSIEYPDDIPFGDDESDEKRHMMVKDLYKKIEWNDRTVVWLAPNGDWLGIDVIVPDGDDKAIIISTDDTRRTLKMTDMITVRFPFGWDDEDLTDTQEVEIISDDQPTLASMIWDDLTIELATNGWFDEMRFDHNTIIFVKDDEIILRLSRPTRNDFAIDLMNDTYRQIPNLPSPKKFGYIPF